MQNKFESVLVRWMNLEIAIQSEGSQKEKSKYSVLLYEYGIQKMVLINLFAGKQWRHKCSEWICGHSRGRKEWDKWRMQHQHIYTIERLLLIHANTLGFLAPGGEEFNLGPETRLDRSELLCNKVLLKYKGDRESF